MTEDFLKQVENTEEKGEIACYEQFLLFSTVFSRLVLQTCKNKGLFGNGLIHREDWDQTSDLHVLKSSMLLTKRSGFSKALVPAI